MRAADPSAKALIFSQYVSTLEWLQARLSAEGFGYRTISGSMALKKRAEVRTPADRTSETSNPKPYEHACGCARLYVPHSGL